MMIIQLLLNLKTNYEHSTFHSDVCRRPLPFSDYYHVRTPQNDYRESRSIRDDFGKNLMGTEYDEQDWQRDLAFMTQCVRTFPLPRKVERL